MMTAAGPFTVKLGPLDSYNTDPASMVGRRSIDKQFTGALAATSKGEMLAAGTPEKGSAGYVAIERVTGTLDGREGSFTLQHSATMNRGTPSLSIHVIPDSATGALAGLTGTMMIDIAPDGAHSYRLEYTLP